MDKVVILARVSTQAQDYQRQVTELQDYCKNDGARLDDQKTKCEEYVLQRSLNIVGYYGGTHESAQTPGPMIKKMIQAVKKDSTIKYILVTEFDRFSRNAGQVITLIETLQRVIKKKKRKNLSIFPLSYRGAVGETRTRTGLLPLPPQSSVSTISPPPLLNWDCKGSTKNQFRKLFLNFYGFSFSHASILRL